MDASSLYLKHREAECIKNGGRGGGVGGGFAQEERGAVPFVIQKGAARGELGGYLACGVIHRVYAFWLLFWRFVRIGEGGK